MVPGTEAISVPLYCTCELSIGSDLFLAIRLETQPVGLGHGLTGPSAPRMAPWSLQGPIHDEPRQPVPEPSPAADLQRQSP